jgi:hypothetical protein
VKQLGLLVHAAFIAEFHNKNWLVETVLTRNDIPILIDGESGIVEYDLTTPLPPEIVTALRESFVQVPVYPEASQPITLRTAGPADWLRPDVRDFLEHSDLDLFAIDSAILTWVCPSSGDWGWREDQVLFRFDPTLIEHDLPADMLEISHTFVAQNPEKLDSIKYCAVELSCRPRDAGGKLLVVARPVMYLTAHPINDALIQFLKPGADRSFRDRRYSKLEDRTLPLVPNMLIAHVLVVTGDDQLLLMRRRADKELDSYRGYWSASFEEHYNAPWRVYLSEQKVHWESRVVDETIFQGLQRGLYEEVKLSDDEIAETVIRVLAVGFEYDNFNTGVFAVAELPRHLTYEKMAKRLPPHEEHDRIRSCPFDIVTLLPSVLHSVPPRGLNERSGSGCTEWKWHPTSRMRILLALRRRYGEVEFRRWLE